MLDFSKKIVILEEEKNSIFQLPIWIQRIGLSNRLPLKKYRQRMNLPSEEVEAYLAKVCAWKLQAEAWSGEQTWAAEA